ncbi:hypothetical protein RF11_06139 [Thelohanellus kitauei]|uniref:Uncharacterized protein n=1 Tax=Thelohanellus kitauei TaxID=669202 RepID=A0A0C2MT90_THEKT|nr:hypothetical protein RF11_06139 [Thelohanellus kitauei]
MRLVGDLKDPDSYFMERQLNHMLDCECKSKNCLKNRMYMDRESFQSINHCSSLSKYGATMLHRQCDMIPMQRRQPEMILTKYHDPGYPFYYLYTVPDTEFMFETLSSGYKDRVPNFLLPEIPKLKAEFKGMDDFIFSETFFNFIVECFVKWYRNPNLWGRDSIDLFLIILLILCLILRVSKNRSICESYRERMFDFFGPHRKLENRSLLDIIKSELTTSQHPLVAAMVDRFIILSHLAKRNIANI